MIQKVACISAASVCLATNGVLTIPSELSAYPKRVSKCRTVVHLTLDTIVFSANCNIALALLLKNPGNGESSCSNADRVPKHLSSSKCFCVPS